MKKIIMKKIVASIVGLTVAGALSAAKNRFAPWWGELFSISCKGVHMYLKKLFAPVVGLLVADVVSAAKIGFAPWWVNRSRHPQLKEVIMGKKKKLFASVVGLTPAGFWSAAKMQSLLLTMMLAVLWVSPAAVAADKKMVTDPSTGKIVTAPEYGGTLTYAWGGRVGDNQDPFVAGIEPAWLIDGVNEKLAHGDWALDREEFDFKSGYVPLFAFTGNLVESWETPDDTTYVFHIRQGVHYALDPDSEASRLVNGRELTADDIVFNFHRMFGLGDFTEPSSFAAWWGKMPWESIEATDKYTVVMKMTEPTLGALRTILNGVLLWILPPEVIEKYGDYSDWKNVVGSGPLMLTDYVEGVSKTFTKNPDYWGYDEKYPENRLPYVDQMRALLMAEEATRISALRTGKVDIIQHAGVVDIKTLDVVRSLRKTDPEIVTWPFFERSYGCFALNIRKPPFDDIRVRHALQMALDLETINETYYSGFAKWEPRGFSVVKGYSTPFEEWPAELKQYYRYDPQGAEKLLDEAGYPRGADGVRFKVDHQHRDVIDLGYVEIAASYWADIGVDVTINILDTAALIANRTEQNYEMITGDMAFSASSATLIGFYRPNQHVYALVGGVETPELTAAYDAFFAATTEEGQTKAFKEFDMALVKQHNQIWGPLAPLFQANQPWVKGFNGEYTMGDLLHHTILARLWIDQDLKKEMGF